MLGKLVFYSVAFITAWTGLVLTFRGYAVPGVLVLGFGCTLFNTIYSANGGEA